MRMVKRMKRQSTLFSADETPVITELDLKEAERVANQIKTFAEPQCDSIEVVGSIRRQKPRVHDVDFVAVAKTDASWHKISEELKRMKAKQSCSGNSVIKAFLPCQNGLFKVDFYRAQPSTLGINLLIRTGSAEHNMWLAGYAISNNMRIKYSKVLVKDGTVVAGEDEKGVFDALNLPIPKPTEREIVDGKPVWFRFQESAPF